MLPPYLDNNIKEAITFINNEEIWKPITKPELKENIYFVSSHGRVFSNGYVNFNSLESKYLTFEISNTGYYRVHLVGKDNIPNHYGVHRLVLETFNPVENMDKLFVNHIDGNKLNNHLYNLEWTTPEENAQHAIYNGLTTWRVGDDCSWSSINFETADKIGQMLLSGVKRSEIMNSLKVNKAVVTNIANGISWREVYVKYKLWNLRKPINTIFSDQDIYNITEYIVNNINKYDLQFLRPLCMDICKYVLNTKINRTLHIELMDLIYKYLDENNML